MNYTISYASPKARINVEQLIQQKKISLAIQNKSLKHILSEIEKMTGIGYVIKEGENIDAINKLSINVQNVTIEQALNTLLSKTGYIYKIDRDIIIISPEKGVKEKQQPLAQTLVISGEVVDAEDHKPVAGATVIIQNSTNGAITDANGKFKLFIKKGEQFEVSYTGLTTQIIKAEKPEEKLIIVMKKDAMVVDDVVVTGIFSRTKESFTGSAATYTAKDLKRVGNGNILQSLKSLDPAFAIIENNQYGSDPNRLPDIEIRGKTSVIGLTSEYKTDPNQPLFILDGFESTLAAISDLSMDRVQSIVVLKDAAATAIYGSKAANGVIVVETKVPTMGKLAINYNGNFILSFADLSDYNLMNASEKLEFEKLSGHYGNLDSSGQFIDESMADKYYLRKAEIARGVNSYWMNEPLRTTFKHTHNLYIEGGENKLRYGVGFSYGDNKGVMKDSGRELMNGNIRLIYRTKKIAVSNQTNLNYSLSTREKVPFSEFSRTNPFFKKRDENGEILKVIERFVYTNTREEDLYNPMYNNSLGSYDDSSTMGFTNNTDVDWFILDGLKAKVRFGISKSSSRQISFISPFHTDFEKMDRLKKGRYTRNDGSDLGYDGDFNITYGKLLKEKHMINAVIGSRLNDNSSMNTGYVTEGFIDDEYSNPAFSVGYPESSKKPSYSESFRRSASFYFNGGYSYASRYMLDINLRSDGSSVFGSSKRFTTTWSLGLAWNIHNEPFMKEIKWLSLLKVRGTMGNPGNQNFDPYIALKTYSYNNSIQNQFGLSTIISKHGNKNLEWQKTVDKNLGIDLEILNRKLMISFDTYNKLTDPLLIYINMPTSSGTQSVPRNVGSQETKGYTISATYRIIQNSDLNWNVNANTRHQNSTYDNIGTSLDSYNEKNKTAKNKSKSLVRYYDGASPTAMWTVRSAGIDPGTGREIFIKKNGTQTFVYDYNDEVVVGDSRAKLEGIIGTSLYYKGFSVSASLRYKFGGKVFMSALYDKVENISEGSLRYNQDKRALSDRWQRPGMDAKFKSISITETTPMSSRFVATENTFSGESISVGYDTQNKWLRHLGVSSISFRAYMNDIFRISSVKNERGIEYPFERSVSFSLGLRF